MTKITDPELEKEFILHELETERAAWLGAIMDERIGERDASYRRLNALLGELYDVNKFLGVIVPLDCKDPSDEALSSLEGKQGETP